MPAKADCTAAFLKQASIYYKDICPEQSRYLMQQQQHINGEEELDATLCPFCFQWRQPDNHRVRIKPKRKASKQIQKVLRRVAAQKRLSLEQQKALRRFRNSCSTRMATCHTCNKISRSRGVSRDTVAALTRAPNTPLNSGKPKKMLGQTPHSGGGKVLTKSTEKTSYGTPRSASSDSTGTPASVSGDRKKSPFSRLRKILTLSETPKKEKAGLKAFLSSL